MNVCKLSRCALGASVLAALLAACSGGPANGPTGTASLPAVVGGSSTPGGAARSAGHAVAYQANAQHTGDAGGKLRLPLTQRWAANLGAGVGYPVVAGGIVVVAANGALIGVSAKTGKTLWSQTAPSGGGWVGAAYDGGDVFSNVLYTNGSSGIGMFAFDAKSGTQLWSAKMPGQYAFSSPPAAASGTVYTGGAGTGGTVYAYAESSGQLDWTASVENGDDSSPVVTSSGVYVSYACPQTYDLNPTNGSQIWHYNGPCEGGGGSTPVLYDKLLFVEDSDVRSGDDGLILSAAQGSVTGYFNSIFPPAFAHHRGFFVTNQTTLTAQSIPSMSTDWTVTLSGGSYSTPPLVVGTVVYIETASGELLGYAAKTGKQTLEMSLGYSDASPGFSPGLAYGAHELIVPCGSELIALRGK